MASWYRAGRPAALPARNASSKPVRSTAWACCDELSPKAKSSRPADLLGREPADTAAVYPADQFPDQVPVEQRRLAMRGPGLP